MNDGLVIELQSVEKWFQSGSERLQVLAGVNLEVESGTSVVITGESGCGKTTLLNIIGSLEFPSAGTARVAGFRLDSLGEAELTEYRQHVVGLVFQFHFLLKDFTALENVLLPAYMAGVDREPAESRARDLLREVGLGERLQHFPHQLSGGERQRVAVARSLVNDPAILLADEPTGNLDEYNSELVADTLFELVQGRHTTLVMVTHDRELGARGERLLRLERGGLAAV